MNIYTRINQLLREKKMTRKDLSVKTKISYNTLTSLFQRSSKNINLESMEKIANALNVSIDFLVSGTEPKSLTIEEESFLYSNNSSNLENEIFRVSKSLNLKHKTQLLAFAYELEDRENKNNK